MRESTIVSRLKRGLEHYSRTYALRRDNWGDGDTYHLSAKDGFSLLRLVGELQDQKCFQELNWSGSFQDYLDIVAKNPRVTRNAYQRIYDMVMEYGLDEFEDAKKRLTRYCFFGDSSFDGDDTIFGLEISLMRLVNFFKAAAKGYGTEKRVLLLHGPVGSSNEPTTTASFTTKTSLRTSVDFWA